MMSLYDQQTISGWVKRGNRKDRSVTALKGAITKLKKKLLLSESQNYCKICGNTLDGYKPKEVQ